MQQQAPARQTRPRAGAARPARLVHDDVVDGVLLGVLVVAEPDGEALGVKARKVLRACARASGSAPGLELPADGPKPSAAERRESEHMFGAQGQTMGHSAGAQERSSRAPPAWASWGRPRPATGPAPRPPGTWPPACWSRAASTSPAPSGSSAARPAGFWPWAPAWARPGRRPPPRARAPAACRRRTPFTPLGLLHADGRARRARAASQRP
jgi:hypothetical protein